MVVIARSLSLMVWVKLVEVLRYGFDGSLVTAELKPNSVGLCWRPRKSLKPPVPELIIPLPKVAPLITAVAVWTRRSTSSLPSAVRSVICARETVGSLSSLSKIASPLVSTRMAILNPLSEYKRRPRLSQHATTRHPSEFQTVWLISHLGRAICIEQNVRYSRVRLRLVNKTLPLNRLNARGFSVHGECDTDGRVLIGCVGRIPDARPDRAAFTGSCAT